MMKQSQETVSWLFQHTVHRDVDVVEYLMENSSILQLQFDFVNCSFVADVSWSSCTFIVLSKSWKDKTQPWKFLSLYQCRRWLEHFYFGWTGQIQFLSLNQRKSSPYNRDQALSFQLSQLRGGCMCLFTWIAVAFNRIIKPGMHFTWPWQNFWFPQVTLWSLLDSKTNLLLLLTLPELYFC